MIKTWSALVLVPMKVVVVESLCFSTSVVVNVKKRVTSAVETPPMILILCMRYIETTPPKSPIQEWRLQLVSKLKYRRKGHASSHDSGYSVVTFIDSNT
jgi:hypothetical protein